MLGTVLPTRASLAAEERQYRADSARRDSIAATLAGETRLVGGELRVYETESRYAVVSLSGRVLRFEIRADGHSYSVKA